MKLPGGHVYGFTPYVRLGHHASDSMLCQHPVGHSITLMPVMHACTARHSAQFKLQINVQQNRGYALSVSMACVEGHNTTALKVPGRSLSRVLDEPNPV